MVSKADEYWDEVGDNPLVIISEMKKMWTENISNFIEDEDFDTILSTAVRLIAGDVPEPAKVGYLIVKLQAISLKFRMQYTAYMGWQKGTDDANMKKNLYRHTYEGIDRLVDALKYMAH